MKKFILMRCIVVLLVLSVLGFFTVAAAEGSEPKPEKIVIGHVNVYMADASIVRAIFVQ